ncbi:hypothetical protein GGR51DRAFT_421871 [Nemania sp. FL0031]|nr:hypothetical protein GGR51DRAFT_421871 [Nemania sp. FL0031]
MASHDWERHKGIITHLYLTERMKLDQVVSYMREEHNFEKSKNSYEIRLKKWGIKKNMRQKDWQNIPKQLNEGLLGKSTVTLSGMFLPHDKVRKEIQRYKNIPTADDFRKGLPSPNMSLSASVRVQSFPTIDLNISWPETLPFFSFKSRVLLTLQSPLQLLRAFFDTPFKYEGTGGMSLYLAWRNPPELRQAVLRLSNEIPNDAKDRQQKAAALARNEFPPCLVTEMLKIIFFRLSNNMDQPDNSWNQHIHDQFVFHLARAVSRSNPELLSALFSGNDATSKAIREAVYGCAIRERNHEFVDLLLKSGVDPNLPVRVLRFVLPVFKRGLIVLQWMKTLSTISGIQGAAINLDIHLGKMLLNAGANVNNDNEIIILTAMANRGANNNDVWDFIRLLIEHGATASPSVSRCSWGHIQDNQSLLFALAIFDNDPRLTEFLIENGAFANLSAYFRIADQSCRCAYGSWGGARLGNLDIPLNYVQFAVISGNSCIIEQLLQQILILPSQFPQETIKQLLITSCLVGDMAIASKLLMLEGIDLDLNNGWCLGITPLVASAWNSDTSIAEALLSLGASVGPKSRGTNLQTSSLCPIHVAAYHGNSNLVLQLMNRGADCKVRYVSPSKWQGEYDPDYLRWLAPGGLSSPLEFALESKDADTITLLLSHFNLLNGDSSENNALISDLTAERPYVFSRFNKPTHYAAAVIAGSEKIVRFHLSCGETYTSTSLHLATIAAIESKNDSIVKLLAGYRARGQVDMHEASCLVLAIAKCRWELVDLFLCEPFLAGPSQSLYDDHIFDYPSCRVQWPSPKLGITPFSAAIRLGNIDLFKTMIQCGYVPRASEIKAVLGGKTPETTLTAFWSKFLLRSMDFECHRAMLVFAIETKDVIKAREVIDLFPSLDFCVFHRDNKDYTPIILATEMGYIDIVRLFLDSGADPYFILEEAKAPSRRWTVVDRALLQNATALEVAAFKGHLNIVELLLNRGGIDPSIQMRSAIEALQIVASLGNLNIVRLLMNWGVDVNAKAMNGEGLTALEGAAINGRLDTVQFLLENGAKVDAPVRIRYIRSIFFATQHGHSAVADHLRKCGSWGETDQAVYCRLDAFYHWQGHQLPVNTWLENWMRWSDGRFSMDSSVNHPCDTSSNGSPKRRNVQGDGTEEFIEIMDRYDETNETPLAILGSTELSLANRNNLDFINEQTETCDLEVPQALGATGAITEIGNISGTRDIIQQTTILSQRRTGYEIPANSTCYNILDARVANDREIDSASGLGDARAAIEGLPLFGPGEYMLEMGFQGEQRMFIDGRETGVEDLFTSTDEFDVSSITLEGIPTQLVPEFDIGHLDAADMESVLRGAVDEGWRGPFTYDDRN